ncbi:MAG: Fic family protein, partial [Pollutimonas bauzanensis]
PQARPEKNAYLRQVDEVYVTDAYHSLSIEGYRVSTDLIERVRSGAWNPDSHAADRNHRDAMAARGYWQAFQRVKQSLASILDGKNPGSGVQQDHGAWYRELFAPSVTTGILRPADLAGYRSGAVYIRRSKHVPPRHEAVRELMPAFFRHLRDEPDPAVRVVLGHFILVYIHPYFDGNGRMGRFMMNAMLAAGGYPWTVIPVEKRGGYMAALEAASVEGDIVPFAQFIGRLVEGTTSPS